MSISDYPLKNSAILDSGSTIHIFTEIARFLNFNRAPEGDVVYAGDSTVRIVGYGDVDISIIGAKKKLQKLRLYNVAYCPNFATNLVSLRQLMGLGYYWDNHPTAQCLRRNDKSVLAFVKDCHSQFVLEYIPHDHRDIRTAFFVRRHRYNSYTKRKASKADAMKWHLRTGHPGSEAIRHLVGASTGVRLTGPTTVQCDACGTSKAKRIIRRYPRAIEAEPGARLALDFHDIEESSQTGFKNIMLITDRYSGLVWDYYLSDRKGPTLYHALSGFLGHLHRQYNIKPKVIETDNEIMRHSQLVDWLDRAYIKIEPSPPDTQDLNGGAERSGGVVKDKARAMREASKLPTDLWPEIYRTAVYLLNRTPRYQYDWKSPYERFHHAVAKNKGLNIPNFKPQQAHLRVFGCKAFALTPDYMRKKNRIQRFNPKAWIGYLVGYDSTNIYRIWNPAKGVIIKIRDVIFNEDEVFDGNLEKLKDEIRGIKLDDLAELLSNLDVAKSPQQEDNNVTQPDALTDDLVLQISGARGNGEIEELVENVDSSDILEVAESASPPNIGDISANKNSPLEGGDIDSANQDIAVGDSTLYPTPPETPHATLLAATIQNSTDKDTIPSNLLGEMSQFDNDALTAWKSAFLAGQKERPAWKIDNKVYDRVKIERAIRKGLLARLHRRDLPPAPKTHKDLKNHPMRSQFLKAERDHLESHIPTKSWTEIDGHEAQGEQVLGSMWVYVYKFDKHGRLQKCKARLVVRGDQQAKSKLQDTYAATLAGRSFRTFMAIAARFDMELKQYDAINAFMNASLDTPTYMQMPPGYRKFGKILRLNKALYGLRISPLLWQRTLTSTLLDLGFESIPHEPCCMTKQGIFIFFYVDDIVLAYEKKQEHDAIKIMSQLQARYKISGGEELQWFLGIRVIRSREKRLIWLSQAAYIDKISKLADTIQKVKTPMTRDELLPYRGIATASSILSYQRKIGSVMYVTVNTRPDIAFAVSRLARFLINPGPAHHKAADRVLGYLKLHAGFALQLGGGDNFTVASDASFADNSVDRKSSQAYIMTLFGGTIGWQANKQNTVTTSTTEAELLALSQAAKEGLYVSRLLREMNIKLDNHRLQIDCDNKQTIRLVTTEIARLQTKLRHVDIHNHWIRQEVRDGRIHVNYMPTKQMIANGLTKALGDADHKVFLKQINLVNIADKLQDANVNEPLPDPIEILFPDD